MLLTSTPLERHSAAREFLFVLQRGRSIKTITVPSRSHQQRNPSVKHPLPPDRAVAPPVGADDRHSFRVLVCSARLNMAAACESR